jgi:hypothetical protein
MAGYGSNLPSSFRLVYAVKKSRWQVWQLLLKLQQRKVGKRAGKDKRIEITMGISCHTCHAFSVFGLGMPFRVIATCHQTCHDLSYVELEHVMSGHKKPSDERSTT